MILNKVLENGSYLKGFIEPEKNCYRVFFNYVITGAKTSHPKYPATKGQFYGHCKKDGTLFFNGQGHVNFLECGKDILDYFEIYLWELV